MSNTPSFEHLQNHQRDLEDYKHNVHRTSDARFGPAWWGSWEQHLQLAADATIVDLGAGTGTFLKKLRARMPAATLTGVELHPDLLALAQTNLDDSSIQWIQADLATPVPLPEASADVVVSSLTFHELPHPPDLLKNAARILRPSGWLVLFDIVKWPLSVYMEGKEVCPDTLDHFREHCLFTPDDLRWLVEQAGFEVAEVITRNNGKFAQIIAQRLYRAAGSS